MSWWCGAEHPWGYKTQQEFSTTCDCFRHENIISIPLDIAWSINKKEGEASSIIFDIFFLIAPPTNDQYNNIEFGFFPKINQIVRNT